MPRIAVILPDLLRRAGMAAVLERYFAPVAVESFGAVDEEVKENGPFDFYFTDCATFTTHVDFFLPRRNQCVILVPEGDAAFSETETPRVISTGGTLESLLENIGRVLVTGRAAEETPSDELSAREVQVLQLVVAGAINKEIADRLHISLNTVLTHRKNITAKLGIKTISGLTLYALMHGYVSNEDIGM